jgi:ketosteroid isomerase-like protein
MRYVTLGAVLCLAAATSAAAELPDPQLTAPIRTFIDAFNRGDSAAAAATHAATPDLTIIDEVEPHLWQGTRAFQSWAADLDGDSKKREITDQVVTLSPASRVVTNGREAYVVVPAVYTFKLKGAPMRVAAQMTYVLKKDPGGWLIHAWTWTGPSPKAAPAK